MTISENRSRVLAQEHHCLALSWGWGKYRSNKTIDGRRVARMTRWEEPRDRIGGLRRSCYCLSSRFRDTSKQPKKLLNFNCNILSVSVASSHTPTVTRRRTLGWKSSDQIGRRRCDRRTQIQMASSHSLQSGEDTSTIFKSRREHRGSTRCGPLFRLAAFGELSCVSDSTWRKSPALVRRRPVRNVAIKTV